MDGSTGLGHIAGLRSGDGHHCGGMGSNHGRSGSGDHRRSRLDEQGSSRGKGQGNGSGNSRCLDGHRTGDGGGSDHHSSMDGGQEGHHRAVDTPGQSEQDYDNGELEIKMEIRINKFICKY